MLTDDMYIGYVFRPLLEVLQVESWTLRDPPRGTDLKISIAFRSVWIVSSGTLQMPWYLKSVSKFKRRRLPSEKTRNAWHLRQELNCVRRVTLILSPFKWLRSRFVPTSTYPFQETVERYLNAPTTGTTTTATIPLKETEAGVQKPSSTLLIISTQILIYLMVSSLSSISLFDRIKSFVLLNKKVLDLSYKGKRFLTTPKTTTTNKELFYFLFF